MPIINKKNLEKGKRVRDGLSSIVFHSPGSKRLKRSRGINTRWRVDMNSFSTVDASFGGSLGKELKLLNKKFQNQKLNVLDWGCGAGACLFDLAYLFPKINFHGMSSYGYKSYQDAKNHSNLTFYQTFHTAFLRLAKKKKMKFQLIYSYSGLVHLERAELLKHLIDLRGVLTVGGKILNAAPYNGLELTPSEKKQLEKSGYKIEFSDGELRALTRVK